MVETNKFYIKGKYISKDNICIDNVDIMVDPNTIIDIPTNCRVDFAKENDITYYGRGYILNENE